MKGDNGFFIRRRHEDLMIARARGGIAPVAVLALGLALVAALVTPAWAAPLKGQRDRASRVCPQRYAPVCADAPSPCFVKPCPEMPQTFSNACVARLAGARIVYHGRCRANDEHRVLRNERKRRRNPREPEKDPNCKSWTDGCNICRRTRPGGEADCSDGPCGTVAPKRCLTYFQKRGKCR